MQLKTNTPQKKNLFNKYNASPKLIGAQNRTIENPGMLSGGGFDLSKLLGLASTGVGLAGLTGDLMGRGQLDWSPELTAEGAKTDFSKLANRLKGNVASEASQIGSDVSSGYIARGLGTGGEQLNDITDARTKASSTMSDIDLQVEQQLNEMLKYIEQRDMMLAQQEQQSRMSGFQDLAEVGLNLGMFLL